MPDPSLIGSDLSNISAGFSAAQGLMQMLVAIRNVRDTNVISALFDAHGIRTDGNKGVSVTVHPVTDDETRWLFEVDSIDGYTFMRLPLAGSAAFEDIGTLGGAHDPDARYFRWVAPMPESSLDYSGKSGPDLLTQLVIVGYRTKALLGYFSTRAKSPD
jgi:hypothetical protein